MDFGIFSPTVGLAGGWGLLWLFMALASQSKPSHRPLPVVATLSWMNHIRCRKECKPNFSTSSVVLAAKGRSCLLAKTSNGFPWSSSSARTRSSSCRASCSLSRSHESTTKTMPSVVANQCLKSGRMKVRPPTSQAFKVMNLADPSNSKVSNKKPTVGMCVWICPPCLLFMLCSVVVLPAASRPMTITSRCWRPQSDEPRASMALKPAATTRFLT
mmetsp:Transcript_49335/g.107435  ORF Transcript_49335/g.107435 Transcript_49335/m.107435 type:complete len:215 (+) Transcript_49335:131-775(+)